MTTYTYEQVRVTVSKSGTCATCGKAARRQTTITNTVSPFNRNDDGTVRTRSEVLARVRQLARQWQTAPVVHAACEATS